jgi:hypothetical protein
VLLGDPGIFSDVMSTAPKTVSRTSSPQLDHLLDKQQAGAIAHLDEPSSGNAVALSEV